MVFRLPSESLLATPRPSRPSRVRFETRDVRVARSSTGVRCTCGPRSRWCAAPQRLPRLDKYPPAQVKLIVYASARDFGANTVSDMARFPANTSVLLKKSDESQTQNTPDPRYLRSFSRAVRQKLAPREFSQPLYVFFEWPPARIADRAAHGSTMHGGHVDRWTERATSNLGASHSGACLRAYPAPRDAVRVHASSPRKRAIRASHSASLPCRDPGSDADLPPLRAQTKAARSGASCAPDARAKGASRCWCTRRYAHGEDACVRETCHKNA